MFYADLHIHSKYSRATSKDCDLEHLSLWGAKKGLAVISTGDFTHPKWFLEINEKLDYLGDGTFQLKDEIKKDIFKSYPDLIAPKFILSVEISTIYKDMDKTRKVHHVVFCPDIKSASRFREALDRIGNIKSDGRPILGLNSRDLLDIALSASEFSYIIPAHIWTPWFSVLGSKSGYDSIEDCYKDLSNHIFALETGLSSDPYMNWRVSKLDKYRLVSNSDAHSPSKLAREATIFDTDEDYFSIRKALKDGTGYYGTVEFFPEEGKYHLDGHRKCAVSLDPAETKKLKGICPICNKPLTIGVSYRVEELSDRGHDFTPPKTAGHVLSLVPLNEILAEIMGVGASSKKVEFEYERLIQKFGSELNILAHHDLDEIGADSPVLKIALSRLREGKVIKHAGYDGEYGVIKLFKDDEIAKNSLNLKLNLNLAPVAKKTKTYEYNAPAEAQGGNDELSPWLYDAALAICDCTGGKIQDIKKQQDSFVSSGFDEYQKEAIYDTSPALLITAGPGAGKTTVITHKIAHIIKENNANAQNILAITFTKKACSQMRDRLEKLLEDKAKDINIHTFHSLCYKILKEQGQIIGLNPDFQVVTKEEKQFYQEKPDLYLDFDDLISKTLELFLKYDDIKNIYKNQFQYIFVDEYQDIDINQYNLIKYLYTKNIVAIGDRNQSIYGFRGGSAKYFDTFSDDFKDAKQIYLKNNYRSTKNIVDLTNQIINNPLISAKTNKNLDKITIHKAPTTASEAEFVVSEIERLIGGNSFFSLDSNRSEGYLNEQNFSYSDFAILYRTQNQLHDIIPALDRSIMPYIVLSNDLLIENKEIKKLLENLKYENIKEQIMSSEIDENIKKYLINIAQNSSNKNDFIHEVSFSTTLDTLDKRADRIKLMTLHASKGLEFRCVFIMGAQEGIIPFYLSDDIEEERRLFYVGATRAQELLYITNSEKRLIKGQMKEQTPSRFLEKLQEELLNYSKFNKAFKKEDKTTQLKLF